MKQLTLGVFLLLVGSFATTCSAATCYYHRRSNQISCGGVTCSAEGNVNGGKLPAGYYYIGAFRTHQRYDVPWFNLYKQKNDESGFWDYHTRIPEAGCRGGFGLHPGTRSEGCITVTDDYCFDRIRSVINGHGDATSFSVSECRWCVFGRCLRGTNQTTALRSNADLQVS